MKPKNACLLASPDRLRKPATYSHRIFPPQSLHQNNLISFLRAKRKALLQKHLSNRAHHPHMLILVLETTGSVIFDGNEQMLHPGAG